MIAILEHTWYYLNRIISFAFASECSVTEQEEIMVTIKDIAKQAGVAQGTVSNVLNGKGNVSSEKIKRVLDAASQLGYVPNERAALLRKGLSDSLAVIMPDSSRARQYEDFYSAFKSYARRKGFSVTRYLTNENIPESEGEALMETRPLLVKGIACLSIVAGTPYEDSVYKNKNASPLTMEPELLFVERRPLCAADFIGFNYQAAGRRLAKKALSRGFEHICLLTGNLSHSNEADFYHSFLTVMEGSDCQITHIQTDFFRRYQNIMQIFNQPMPQAFCISNYGFAEGVKDICLTFYDPSQCPEIYTVSPIFTMPENDFIKYEMDYRLLGKQAAERLIRKTLKKREDTHKVTYLEGNGFRNWHANIIVPKSSCSLNVITLDSPEAYIMQNFTRLYTKKSNIPVNICIYSYDEIYEAFNALNAGSSFDILRLDVTWLSWFADKLLLPLTEIDPDIGSGLSAFLNGVPEHYSRIHGQIYALPSTPSTQLLYYRKDLFESPIYKRMYYEQYKAELKPPETFEEFNRIAAFFTKSIHPASPVDYGATLTLGSTGVAGTEFMSRLFSRQDNLYDSKEEIHLDSAACLQSLEELLELRLYTSPSYCNWWVDTARNFASGNFAMSILYSNFASDLLAQNSHVVGNIGYTMMPGANPIIGGGSLGVSRYSRHPKEALSFIKWMCSEPISSAAALLGSTSPCKKTYENYEVVNNFPWINLAERCFPLARGRRLPERELTPFDERKYLNILGMAVKNSYSNICSPEKALKNAQELFEKHFQWRF